MAGKARSHGFLPLFLSQFLLLGGVAGAIAALVKLPESKWAELTQVGRESGKRQVAACDACGNRMLMMMVMMMMTDPVLC